MTLKEHYAKIPRGKKRRFRLDISEACGVSELHVYKWLKGEHTPDKLKQEAISKIVNIPTNLLFPAA